MCTRTHTPNTYTYTHKGGIKRNAHIRVKKLSRIGVMILFLGQSCAVMILRGWFYPSAWMGLMREGLGALLLGLVMIMENCRVGSWACRSYGEVLWVGCRVWLGFFVMIMENFWGLALFDPIAGEVL